MLDCRIKRTEEGSPPIALEQKKGNEEHQGNQNLSSDTMLDLERKRYEMIRCLSCCIHESAIQGLIQMTEDG